MRYKNIILTGIMGCGKTTAGRMAAKELQMEFLDLDQMIESRWGSIQELFQIGEEYFRDLESQAAAEVAEREGLVVATGGGIVKREKNMAALRKKGLVFFIDRPLEDILSDIDTSERPLLKGGKDKLAEIFRERYPLYLKTCDIHIAEAGQLQDVVATIVCRWNDFIYSPAGPGF